MCLQPKSGKPAYTQGQKDSSGRRTAPCSREGAQVQSSQVQGLGEGIGEEQT
jgi:hypothetical protein